MLGSGVGDGEGSSEVGISTSVLPTLYGPVYEGKPGVGLSCERKDTMMEGLKENWCIVRYGCLCYGTALCTLMLMCRRMTVPRKDAIDRNPSE